MNRAGIRVFLVACAVLLVGIGAFNVRPTSAQGDETLGVSGTVTMCAQQPEILWYASVYCTGPSDVVLTFLDESGAEIATCVATYADVAEPKASGCSTERPYGSVTTISLDESTIPEGYYLNSPNPQEFQAPNEAPDGPLDMPLFMLLPIDGPLPVPTGLSVAVVYCDADPSVSPNNLYDSCETAEGVRIEFTDATGAYYDECVTVPGLYPPTVETGLCSVYVPYDSTTTVTIDLSTTLSDYTLSGSASQEWTAPGDASNGTPSLPLFVLVANSDDANVPDDSAEGDDADVTPTVGASPVAGRTVAIYTGDCDNIGDEVATLNDVLPEEGDAVGDENAIPAEVSITNGAAFFLDQAIDEGYALVVYEDETTDTPIACGELGGVNTHDGMLPIGLGEVDESGFVGTAILSYNDTDELTTDVTIVISAELLPEPTATPNS